MDYQTKLRKEAIQALKEVDGFRKSLGLFFGEDTKGNLGKSDFELFESAYRGIIKAYVLVSLYNRDFEEPELMRHESELKKSIERFGGQIVESLFLIQKTVGRKGYDKH